MGRNRIDMESEPQASSGPRNARIDRDDSYLKLVDAAIEADGEWVEMELKSASSVTNAHTKAGREVSRRYCQIVTEGKAGENPKIYMRMNK